MLKKSIFIIITILLIDQILKIWVKTSMYIGEEIPLIGNWCILHFVENNGMAFGFSFFGTTGKFLLSLFRILASIGIAWYLYSLIKEKANKWLIYSISLIFAGAVGNILDSIFYGVIFEESNYNYIANFNPSAGYSSFLHGKVVDMFYCPVYSGFLPEWLGGGYFTFFQPVFNVADSAITVGVIAILFTQKALFKSDKKEVEPINQEE